MDTTVLTQAALGLLLDFASATFILVIGWAVAGWTAGLVRAAAGRNERFDATLASVVVRVVRLGLMAVTLVAVWGRLGIQTTSLVAIVGAAGLAIGLALQGALSNVAAGVMILGLRPFRLGDAVDIAGTAGTVEEIGLFATRLKTFDGVIVHQPNSNIWGSVIRNFSQAQQRRVDLTIGIAFDADVAKAIAIVQGLLEADARILDDPAKLVAVESLGADSVNLLIRFWTAPGDVWTGRLGVTRAVKDAFDAAGIGMPVQQRDLRLRQDRPIEVQQTG